jgi:hypothetical protein
MVEGVVHSCGNRTILRQSPRHSGVVLSKNKGIGARLRRIAPAHTKSHGSLARSGFWPQRWHGPRWVPHSSSCACARLTGPCIRPLSDPKHHGLRYGGVMVPIVPVQCWLAREALGWSMTDLARAAGVSPPTVKRFERWAVIGLYTGREDNIFWRCGGDGKL